MVEINARSQMTIYQLWRVALHVVQIQSRMLPADAAAGHLPSSLGSGRWVGLCDHASTFFGMRFALPLEKINARRTALHRCGSEGRESAIQSCLAQWGEDNVTVPTWRRTSIEWPNANLPNSLAPETIWRFFIPSAAFHPPMLGVS